MTAPLALVIDDNRVIAQSLVQMLTTLGYEAGAVYGSLPAMQVLARTVPDLILLDIHLQGINGVEVCRYIRRSERLATVPVIAISSDTQSEMVTAIHAAGANAFLAKPIQIETLEQMIIEARQDALRRRSQPSPSNLAPTNKD
ncbi:MAG: response regulator [Anaerolineales bacterium]|nr:response regulator [Anaerolineales bacterium]